MSTTDVQLRFAAEFALFLVSLGGLGYALLRPDLLVANRIARVPAALGFAALAAAAFLSGALVIDDPQDTLLLALRVGGVVFLAIASRWWQPAHGGRVLLWIGLLALVVADAAEQLGDDPGSVVYVARGLGAAAIGASLVVASTRAISARIAASAAVILFFVITALAVALSTVITDNVEDEAIRRYGARAATEALAPADEAGAAAQSATVLGVALSNAGDLEAPLTQLTDVAADPASTTEVGSSGTWSATSAMASATKPIHSSTRPPRAVVHQRDATARSSTPAIRIAPSPGSVGSSTTRAPLRKAETAKAANPNAAAKRATHRSTMRSGRSAA